MKLLSNGNIQFFSPQRREFSKLIGSGDFFCLLFCVADKKVRWTLDFSNEEGFAEFDKFLKASSVSILEDLKEIIPVVL